MGDMNLTSYHALLKENGNTFYGIHRQVAGSDVYEFMNNHKILILSLVEGVLCC